MSSFNAAAKAGALLVLALLVAPSVAAAPAPDGLSGTYDPNTEILTLTWGYNPDITVDGFRVFIDGTSVADVTDQEYEDDLDGWGGGTRTYQVAAIENSEQGPLSEEYTVFFSPGDPVLPCGLVGASTDPDEVPPIGVALHPECLPRLGGG